MAEHRIRLRGAWDWILVEDEAEVARRVNLPTRWPTGLSSGFRLLRRFGRPPFDPATESVRLELLDVPGLVSVRLNGREIGRDLTGVDNRSIPLTEPILSRNALILGIDLGAVEGLTPGEEWGSIALVIEPTV